MSWGTSGPRFSYRSYRFYGFLGDIFPIFRGQDFLGLGEKQVYFHIYTSFYWT
jgi:hypothetical protein